MNDTCNSLLFRRVRAKGFKPAHVAEIGVWHPHTSNVYDYIQDGTRTTLVEPDPDSIALIKAEFGNNDNVTLFEAAVFDSNGKVELCKRESSTFVGSLTDSPAIVNDDCDVRKVEKFTADARKFSEIDDGTIDLLSIDTEGSEWFAIKHMKSRPTVVSLETHGGMYVNPYLNELQEWMDENNYLLWYKDKSDSVFVLPDMISVSVVDKINLFKSGLAIAFRRNKKRVSKTIKNIFAPNGTDKEQG